MMVTVQTNGVTLTIRNPTEWADAFLKALGAKITPTNQAEVVGWEAAEGGNWENSAKYNPLNTTEVTPTSHSVITGVQAYQSWAAGLTATLRAIHQSTYTAIVNDLKNSAPYVTFAASVGNSPWASSHYGTPPGSNLLKDIGAPYTVNKLSAADAILTSTTQPLPRQKGLGGVLQTMYFAMTPTATPSLASHGSIAGAIRNGVMMIGSRGIFTTLGLAMIGIGAYMTVGRIGANPVSAIQSAQRIRQGRQRIENVRNAQSLAQQRITAALTTTKQRVDASIATATQRANATTAAAQHRRAAAENVAATRSATRMATAKMQQNTNRATRRLRREQMRARQYTNEANRQLRREQRRPLQTFLTST
jgi:hypothetical protein